MIELIARGEGTEAKNFSRLKLMIWMLERYADHLE